MVKYECWHVVHVSTLEEYCAVMLQWWWFCRTQSLFPNWSGWSAWVKPWHKWQRGWWLVEQPACHWVHQQSEGMYSNLCTVSKKSLLKPDCNIYLIIPAFYGCSVSVQPGGWNTAWSIATSFVSSSMAFKVLKRQRYLWRWFVVQHWFTAIPCHFCLLLFPTGWHTVLTSFIIVLMSCLLHTQTPALQSLIVRVTHHTTNKDKFRPSVLVWLGFVTCLLPHWVTWSCKVMPSLKMWA
jgi:hypothetical protein